MANSKAGSSPPKPGSSPKVASPKSASSPRSTGSEPKVQPVDASILPASHWEHIDAEQEVLDDGDSVFSDNISSTASLSDSIFEYRQLHGRTFHSDVGKAEAWAPNDERMIESMDIHHHMCTLLLGGKLFLSPLETDKVQKVVDIGTGTGIWAIDFGDQFPNAEVIGTELSPMQPSWVPPNVKFEIDDANLAWTWPDNTFDFIHVRALFGAIIDWNKLYEDAYRTCKPGGWFEDHETSAVWQSDDPAAIPKDSPMGQWGKVYHEMGVKFGRTFRVIEDNIQEKAMRAAGFVDIVVKDYKCPVGGWPLDPKLKEVGQFTMLTLQTDIEGYILYTWNAVLGWSPEEIQVYIAHLRRQLNETAQIKPWYIHRVVYGRKPNVDSS